MKKTGLLLIVLLWSGHWLMAGDPLRDNRGSSIGNDPRKDKPEKKIITRDLLIHLVDSLLDLDSVDVREIELVNYYNSLLNSSAASFIVSDPSLLPAASYYDAFDETTAFQIVPENEFPDQQLIVLQSDSLGYYRHPRGGPINSSFGWRHQQMHKGIDIDLNKGDTVYCAFNGVVRIAKKLGGYGNVVIVRHYNGLETVYAHLSKIKVHCGQQIQAGQLLGLGGSTGHSTGPHLHFEVRFRGQALNPSAIISFDNQALLHDSILVKRSGYGICAFPSNAQFHTVEKGDCWYDIAKHYGLSITALCGLNNMSRRYALKVGQKIRIQ